jgi:GT2 family glycosyltransferase
MASIVGQRGVGVELVAVDDGSTDGGGQIVEAAARQGRVRLVLLRTPGLGIVSALRTAAGAATGPWLARMDADDLCAPDRLATQVAMLRSDAGLGAVGTQVELIGADPAGEGLRRYVEWQNSLLTPEDHARDLFVESPLCHPSVVMRRDAFEAVGGYRDPPWAEDYDLWLRLSAGGFGLAKVPRVLLSWRHRPDRLTLTDARYEAARFREAKAHYLAPVLARMARPLVVWGAGPTGRRLARDLEHIGIRATRFVDIDPRKIGGVARGVPIVPPEALEGSRESVLVAVGARGARELIRARLGEMGFVEGRDFLCAA